MTISTEWPDLRSQQSVTVFPTSCKKVSWHSSIVSCFSTRDFIWCHPCSLQAFSFQNIFRWLHPMSLWYFYPNVIRRQWKNLILRNSNKNLSYFSSWPSKNSPLLKRVQRWERVSVGFHQPSSGILVALREKLSKALILIWVTFTYYAVNGVVLFKLYK